MRSHGGVGAAATRLHDTITSLAEVDLGTLSDAAKLDALRDLQPLVWALQAQLSRLVGAVHQSAAASADGYLSTAGWLKAFLRVGDGPAQVRGAKALSVVPQMRSLFEAGGCGPEHVAGL